MIHWWNETPIWQRCMIFGIAGALFLLGMQSWVWSPIQSSIARVSQEVGVLASKNQKSMERIALLKGVEEEVALLRGQLAPTLNQLPVGSKPTAFRREVMDISNRMGVSVRLWKPQLTSRDGEQAHVALDIKVKVEGSFFDTVHFLDEVLELSWLHAVDSLILLRKQNGVNESLVSTDFTIKGLDPHQLSLPEDMQKI